MDVGLEMNVLSLDYKWLLCSCLATGRIIACCPPMPGLLKPKRSLSALYVSNAAGIVCLGHLAKVVASKTYSMSLAIPSRQIR